MRRAMMTSCPDQASWLDEDSTDSDEDSTDSDADSTDSDADGTDSDADGTDSEEDLAEPIPPRGVVPRSTLPARALPTEAPVLPTCSCPPAVSEDELGYAAPQPEDQLAALQESFAQLKLSIAKHYEPETQPPSAFPTTPCGLQNAGSPADFAAPTKFSAERRNRNRKTTRQVRHWSRTIVIRGVKYRHYFLSGSLPTIPEGFPLE